jgi:hypothetical protein
MNSNQYHHFHHHSINEKQNLYSLLKKSNVNIIEESLLKKIIDSSHLITFCISISVIIYASFRSLNIDSQPAAAAESNENKLNLSNRELDDENDDEQQTIQTIDSCQALAIPVAASISLLLMFFFFDSIQTAFLICTSSKIITIIIINKIFI